MAGVFKSLDQADVRITPFRAHKLLYENFYLLWSGSNQWDNTTWNTVTGSKNLTLYLANYNPNSSYPSTDPLQDTFDQGNPYYDALEPKTSDGKYQRVVHASINHLYYRDWYTNTRATFGSGNVNTQVRYLEDKAYVISVPQQRFGEAILQGSAKVHLSWSYAVVSGALYNPISASAQVSGVWTLDDDEFGNFYIKAGEFYSPYGQYVGGVFTDTSSSVDKTVVGEWPFDEVYKYVDSGQFSHTGSYHKGIWQMLSIYNNVSATTLTSSAYPSPSDAEMLGAVLHFTSSLSSSITVKPDIVDDYKYAYSFENGDFSVSMIVMPTQEPTSPNGSVLLLKRGVVEDIRIDLNGNVYTQNHTTKYPYRISYASGSNKLVFERTDGVRSFYMASSVSMSLNTIHHVAVVKSGSYVTLYVNSVNGCSVDTAQCTVSDFDSKNSANVYIGNNYNGTLGFNGYIDNVKIYNEALTENDIKILHHTLGVGNLHVGNCFYNHGMIVLTAIPIRYSDVYDAQCRGSYTIYENEVCCTANPGDFGMSSNPSLQVYDPLQNEFVYSPFVSSSDFKPFVTTVGLYDDYGNLLVVAKLNTPIQLPDNVDTTFIIRYDK